MVALALNAIGARYGSRAIFSDISVDMITGGTLTALIGPNAAGKSTLFKRIAGLVKGAGTVTVDAPRRGEDAICYMPQDTGANAVLTVYESVLLASRSGGSWLVKEGDLVHIDSILEALRITPLAFRNLCELSGGQRQLVSIAQALARRPEILLMDEPTSALDLHRQIEVLHLMRDLARRDDMAVVIALHDLNHALRYCERTLVIADGRLVAAGPSEDVITPALLRDIYKVDARIECCSQGKPLIVVDGAIL
ncbi:ABC transporter ATP-binding protein [Oryzibacter oryziterrae]|uniref:ABC transporter ATP-binding protein n=1 Tax=Oryzibacter oryziterrae TaxID=2766474 RepID=UPI001F38A5D4|nr:ABC transporter ATP-binding protein [Oryzibacter oryziterrae]